MELRTVYITRDSLSKGIIKAVVKMRYDICVSKFCEFGNSHYINDDFWLTEAEALADFERRKAEKIKSLEKQLVKMKALQPKIKS